MELREKVGNLEFEREESQKQVEKLALRARKAEVSVRSTQIVLHWWHGVCGSVDEVNILTLYAARTDRDDNGEVQESIRWRGKNHTCCLLF